MYLRVQLQIRSSELEISLARDAVAIARLTSLSVNTATVATLRLFYGFSLICGQDATNCTWRIKDVAD